MRGERDRYYGRERDYATWERVRDKGGERLLLRERETARGRERERER